MKTNEDPSIPHVFWFQSETSSEQRINPNTYDQVYNTAVNSHHNGLLCGAICYA